MKRFKIQYSLLLFLLIGITCFCPKGQAQNFSTVFLKKYPDKNFSVVTVGRPMIESLKNNEKDPDLASFLNSLTFIGVISASENGTDYCDSAMEMLASYELLMSINTQEKEDTEKIRIVAKNISNNIAQEVVMLVCSQEKLTLVNLTGKIATNKLSNLSSYIQKSISNKKN